MNYKNMTSFSIGLSGILVLTLLCGCQSQPPRAQTLQAARDAEVVKTAEANLTQAEAAARKKLISDLVYSLHISLDGEADLFQGQVTIAFNLASGLPEGSTFLDFKAGAKIQSLSIDGQAVAQPNYENHRISLPANLLHSGANKVEIAYTQTYSHDGRGLHRFQDPEDKKVYLYTQFEAFDAHQMFPCFDQPDLKAKMRLSVSAPQHWQVISTTREISKKSAGDKVNWNFAQTPVLSTYLFSLHAGLYHKWESRAGAVPLRLFARESLARFVDVKDWFTPTKAGLKFYGEYFAYPYPFKKYDQIIAPDFNAGAMENVAAVTFTERFVHRGAITREDREHLASVILHEMAHMWFGDLVTMQWWNGLWLNESFATFMSALSMDKATEFKESWASFYTSEKSWAYFEDQLVTTHPVNGDVIDTDSAFTNFDGITYGKGASVLKQLRFYLGERTFRDGVRYYFKTYAYSNTRLKDFMGALEHASGKDLSAWSDGWLSQAGLDTVRADYDCTDGHVTRFALNLTGPDGKSSPRSHRTIVALYNLKDSRFAPFKTAEVEYKGASTVLPAFVGASCPLMVYPNDQDQDYVKIQLDPRTLAAVRMQLSQVDSAFTRTLLWSNLFQMVRDGQLSPQEYLKTTLANFSKEDDLKTGEEIALHLPIVVYYLPKYGSTREPDWVQQLEKMLWSRLQSVNAGSDWQKSVLEEFVGITETEEARDHLVNLLAGKEKIKGLKVDTDRRWMMIVRLSSLGDERVKPILANEKKQDGSERGLEMAMSAEAAWPTLDVKREWFDKVIQHPEIPFARERSALSHILPPWQDSFRQSLASSFYASMPRLVRTRQAEFLRLFTRAFLPTSCIATESRILTSFLQSHQGELPPAVTKGLLVGRQENDRCVVIRAKALAEK